jgi:xanthine dehydrogenase YagR molybdenum-binding subunit
VIVEGEYFIQVQRYSAVETQGFVVDWKPEEVTVYTSTPGMSSARSEFADVFKLPQSEVRVITEFVGGGFGANSALKMRMWSRRICHERRTLPSS